MENDIINEHRKYLSNHYGIEINSKMEILPLMYWIPKMYKNPVGSRFIIASPKCTLKPLSKNITATFKLFQKKIEKYYSKNRIWSGVKRFGAVKNNVPFIDSVNKRFDVFTLYTKRPSDKLLAVLN